MNRTEKQKEIKSMEKIHKIYESSLFQECLQKNQEAEKTRIFCRHNREHFIDVARLAYIFSMERGYVIPKEEIYAAALLHDIGKWRQYLEGIPHEQASEEIAEVILEECGFSEEEKSRILRAILSHRQVSIGENEEEKLSEVLYDADKLSRACYACHAEKECNWSEEKKNKKIIW